MHKTFMYLEETKEDINNEICLLFFEQDELNSSPFSLNYNIFVIPVKILTSQLYRQNDTKAHVEKINMVENTEKEKVG